MAPRNFVLGCLPYVLPVMALGAVMFAVRHDYDRTYREARFSHADVNCDRFISTDESEAFTKAFIKGKNVTYDSVYGLRTDAGELVPVWTRKNMIEDYVNTHEPVCAPLQRKTSR